MRAGTGPEDGRHTWVDDENEEHALTVHDIVVVAPYNVQVMSLAEAAARYAHWHRRPIPGAGGARAAAAGIGVPQRGPLVTTDRKP
jgi:hypothetical protein